MIDDTFLMMAGVLATAGIVFNVLWGQEVLSHLSRTTLGLSCFSVMTFSVWTV